jgi:hypothetical protein
MSESLTSDLYTAYCYYTHYLKVEVSQSHPVMKAFCGLVLQAASAGGAGQKMRDAEEGCYRHNTLIHGFAQKGCGFFGPSQTLPRHDID